MDDSQFREIDEPELVKRLVAGDRGAFDIIYRRYWAGLVAASRRVMGSEEAAKDVVQNVFLRLWNTRGVFLDVHSNLKGWFGTVVRRESYAYLKSSIMAKTRDLDYLHANSHIAEDIDSQRHLETLRRAIKALSPQQCLVYSMHKLEGKSHQEIANKLDISVNTVRNHVYQANMTVRQVIANQKI